MQKFLEKLSALCFQAEAHRRHDGASESSNFQSGNRQMRTLFNYSLHQRLLGTPAPHPLPPLLLRLLLHHSHHLSPHRLQLLLPVHLPEERLLVLEPLLKLGRQLLSLFGKALDTKVAKSILPLRK